MARSTVWLRRLTTVVNIFTILYIFYLFAEALFFALLAGVALAAVLTIATHTIRSATPQHSSLAKIRLNAWRQEKRP